MGGKGWEPGRRDGLSFQVISGWDQAAGGEGREAIAFLRGRLPEKTHGAGRVGQTRWYGIHPGRQSGLQPDEKGL